MIAGFRSAFDGSLAQSEVATMLVGVAARLGDRIRGNLADCDDRGVVDRPPMSVACRMAVARAGLMPGLNTGIKLKLKL